MSASANPQQWISYVITAVVIAFVLALRIRRMGQTRPLKIERLWIFPVLYAAIAALLFSSLPPSPLGWALSGVALVAGAGLGWQRGRMMRIDVDPVTHSLNQRASPAAIVFLLLIVAARFGARSLVTAGAPLHINALTITDMLVALALGLFTAQRIEMYLRARKLLDDYRMAHG